MKRLSFPKAVDDVLRSAGFSRTKPSEWTRESNGYVDNVYLQVSRSLDLITVNLLMFDIEVSAILRSADIAGHPVGLLYPINERLPSLMTGYDRWWRRSDPDGPTKVAQAIAEHGLPFFERLHSPEAMLGYLNARGSIGWRDPTSRMHVAVILSRLGRKEEALEALSDPPRRVDGPWLAKVEALRRMVAEGATGS